MYSIRDSSSPSGYPGLARPSKKFQKIGARPAKPVEPEFRGQGSGDRRHVPDSKFNVEC